MGLLDGKVAVVHGGWDGNRRAVSLDLARAGASVVVNDYGRQRRRARSVQRPRHTRWVETIGKAGGRAIASPESVATMAGGKALIDLALRHRHESYRESWQPRQVALVRPRGSLRRARC